MFLLLISTLGGLGVFLFGAEEKTLHVFQETSGQKSNATNNAHIVKFVTPGQHLSL